MHFLSFVGPIQMIILLVLVGSINVSPIVLIMIHAKHKADANTLEDVFGRQTTTFDHRFLNWKG
jgi:hypothetical protein